MTPAALARKRRANRLVRLMVFNWIFGVFVGCCCAGLLLAGDIAGLRSLMLRSELMWQALALLFGGFSITFGGVVCATAIMLPSMDEETESSGGKGLGSPVFLPAFVYAKLRASAR